MSDERWALIEPVLTAWRAARVGSGISPERWRAHRTISARLVLRRVCLAYLALHWKPYADNRMIYSGPPTRHAGT